MHVLPHCPPDSALRTNKKQGLLNLIMTGGRAYPLVQIEFDKSETTFRVVKKKGRWVKPYLPSCVTPEMIQKIIDQCFVDGILSIDPN